MCVRQAAVLAEPPGGHPRAVLPGPAVPLSGDRAAAAVCVLILERSSTIESVKPKQSRRVDVPFCELLQLAQEEVEPL